MIRCHLGYDGNLDTVYLTLSIPNGMVVEDFRQLPVRKMKSFRPPPPLVGKPCLWHGCDYRVVKVCALNLAVGSPPLAVRNRVNWLVMRLNLWCLPETRRVYARQWEKRTEPLTCM